MLIVISYPCQINISLKTLADSTVFIRGLNTDFPLISTLLDNNSAIPYPCFEVKPIHSQTMDSLGHATQWLQNRCPSKQLLAFHGCPIEDHSIVAQRLQLIQDSLAVHAALSHLPHRFLKGATLSQFLYGDSIRRPGTDIDVWVRDIEEAALHLQKNGWQRVSKFNSSPKLIRTTVNAETWKRASSVTELHWIPIAKNRMPRGLAEKLWKGFAYVSIREQAMPLPTGPASLLYTILHGSLSRFERLVWLADVHQWMTQYPEDVPGMLDLAKHHELEQHVSLAVELIRRVFGSTPLDLLGPVNSKTIKWADAIESAWIEGRSLSKWQKIQYQIYFFGAWNFILHDLVNPSRNTQELVQLPRYLSILYFPIHWARLSLLLIRNLLKYLRHPK